MLKNREAVLFPAQDVSESFIDKGIDRKFSALTCKTLVFE